MISLHCRQKEIHGPFTRAKHWFFLQFARSKEVCANIPSEAAANPTRRKSLAQNVVNSTDSWRGGYAFENFSLKAQKLFFPHKKKFCFPIMKLSRQEESESHKITVIEFRALSVAVNLMKGVACFCYRLTPHNAGLAFFERKRGLKETGEDLTIFTLNMQRMSSLKCACLGVTEKSPPLWGRDNEGGKASDWSRIQNPAF